MNYIISYEKFKLNESLKYSSGINQQNVPETIQHIKDNLLPLLRLKEENVAFIGSAGKKINQEQSYNINLGIEIKILLENNDIDDNDVFEFIKNQVKRLKYDIDVFKEKNRIVISWPISGLNEKHIELHLQLSNNLDWLKFIRYSPDLNKNESKYTGKHREFLLETISNNLEKKIINYFKEDVVKDYEKYELKYDEGLTKVTKSFEGKNGYLKEPRYIEESRRLITNDKNEFVKILFGENYKSEDLMTFEKVLDAFNSKEFPHKKKREKIKKIFKNKLSSFQLTIPEGLM